MPEPVPGLNAVILAGGSGQRFWPLSRELSPKQMLSVFGTDSLIVQAIRRVLPLVDPERGRVHIVTNERLFDELRNHVTARGEGAFGSVAYLVEPVPRNTAPAIALAAAVLEAKDPGAIMIVLPSDHLLEADDLWADAVESAARLAASGYLVTIGISPTRPETGYGYIRTGERLPEYDGARVRPFSVAEFVEKPDASVAEGYVAAGTYYWNAGIFVMRASRVLEELEDAGEQGRAIAATARWVAERLGRPEDADECRARFGELPAISIDVAVMERSKRAAVIPAPLRWSDVGSLLALEDVAPPDPAGNVRVGRGVDIDSADTIVFTADRLVATLGVRDLMVVDTSDATLVAAKDRAQDVRLVFDALKAAGAEEVTQPKVSLRPWGSWTVLLEGPGFKIKVLEVKPGTKLSLQRHARRSEHWVVVGGTAVVTHGEGEIVVRVNESAFIPIGQPHRLENRGTEPLKVLEVQVGEYVGEDDIERLEDDWSRG